MWGAGLNLWIHVIVQPLRTNEAKEGGRPNSWRTEHGRTLRISTMAIGMLEASSTGAQDTSLKPYAEP